jgi:GntR family transcriptional regulator
MIQTITIDLDSPIPAYRQIVDAMRKLFVAGAMRPGDPVPTVRDLAVDLGVHFNTVAQAYRILAEEGWLDLKRRRGAVVLDREKPAAPNKQQRDHLFQRLHELTAQLQAEGIPPNQIAGQLRKLADALGKGA